MAEAVQMSAQAFRQAMEHAQRNAAAEKERQIEVCSCFPSLTIMRGPYTVWNMLTVRRLIYLTAVERGPIWYRGGLNFHWDIEVLSPFRSRRIGMSSGTFWVPFLLLDPCHSRREPTYSASWSLSPRACCEVHIETINLRQKLGPPITAAAILTLWRSLIHTCES